MVRHIIVLGYILLQLLIMLDDSIATLNLNITSFDISVQSPICEGDSSNIYIEITDPSVNEYTVVINDGFSN